MGEAGADVVGVDWRTPLATAIGQVGRPRVQGNLDPTLVFAPDRGDDRPRRRDHRGRRAAPRARVQPRPRRAAVAPTPTSSTG
jgi:hypothetical protein